MELRVAKAIAGPGNEDAWLGYYGAAISAIRAMREPTPDMQTKMAGSDCGCSDCFIVSYQNGIDLASPPEET